MIVTQVFCDLPGCTTELQQEGGAITLRSPSGAKEYHLCAQHWDKIARNIIEIFDPIKGASSDEKDTNLDRVGDSSGTELPSGGVIQFPEKT